jgi:hypothetical protein
MRPSIRVCYLTNFQSNLIDNFIRWIPYPKGIHRTLTKNVNKTSEFVKVFVNLWEGDDHVALK